MQEQKYRYFIDGKEVDNRTDYLNATMSGDYVSYFDGDSVFSVSFNSFFGENKDNNKMIKREVNGHLSDAINTRLQLSKKINEESLEKYKSLFKPIDQTKYNTLDLGQIKGSSTRHKSQNGEAHKEVVGDLEGINKPPKTEQLNYQSFYQVVYTKPTSNWNKFEIAFSDNDLEKIKDLSIGDIKEMFNSTISAEKTEKEEFLIDDYPLGYKDISKFAVIELERKNKLHCIPTDATNIEVFHLDTKDNGDKTAFIGFKIKNGNFSFVEVPFTSPKIAKKENKTEENLVFPKDSGIHKEDNWVKPKDFFTEEFRKDMNSKEELPSYNLFDNPNYFKHDLDIHKDELPPHEPLDFSVLLTDWVDRMIGTKDRTETFTTEAYKETEGKLFYELDWGFITQMAERMASNKKDSKYSLWNWKKPMTPEGIEDLKQATLRHLLEVLEGNYEDDGREFGHLEAISDNMMMINYQLKNNSK